MALKRMFLLQSSPYTQQDWEDVRQSFRQAGTLDYKKRSGNHSHGLLASQRNAADDTINTMISLTGRPVYSWQKSRRDVNVGIPGSLQHYWHNDTHSQMSADPIPNTAVFKMLNVDYYVDWTHYLWLWQPFILFTFCPLSPAGSGAEGEYHWSTHDDVVTMQVAGGAVYKHKTWDYSVDHITVDYPFVQLTYSVESFRIRDHWCFVCLTPKSVSFSFGLTTQTSLQRRQYTYDAINFSGKSVRINMMPLMSHGKEGPGIVLSANGAPTSVFVKDELWTLLKQRAECNTLTLVDLTSTVSRYYPGTDAAHAQAVIFTCFPTNVLQTKLRFDTQLGWKDRSGITYFVPSNNLFQTAKPTAKVVGPILIDGAVAPARSRENDQKCVDERITKQHNPQQAYSPEIEGYAREFRELLFPNGPELSPVTISQVVDSQKRPTQVRNNTLAMRTLMCFWTLMLVGMDFTVKSFQKSECYSDFKPPRNISTVPAGHCLFYSQYTQSLAQHLKKFKWYAFGMHPDDVALRVHDICSRSKTKIATDFEKFDGTHSDADYAFELSILLAAFPASEHDVIRVIHKALRSKKGRTMFGVAYDPAGSRLSGGADTSLMNTILNVFISYCAYRRMGYSSAAAFAILGIYGGDDGLSPDMDTPALVLTAADMGKKLKSVATLADEPTTFLGRDYPRPYASPENMADLPRQLGKLHVSTALGVTPEEALWNKAQGHLVTDATTPILGNWARAVVRILKRKAAAVTDDATLQPDYCRFYNVSETDRFGIATRPYKAQRFAPAPLPAMQRAVDSLGLDAARITAICAQLDNAVELSDFPTNIIPVVRVVPAGVYCNGVIGAGVVQSSSSSSTLACPPASNAVTHTSAPSVRPPRPTIPLPPVPVLPVAPVSSSNALMPSPSGPPTPAPVKSSNRVHPRRASRAGFVPSQTKVTGSHSQTTRPAPPVSVATTRHPPSPSVVMTAPPSKPSSPLSSQITSASIMDSVEPTSQACSSSSSSAITNALPAGSTLLIPPTKSRPQRPTRTLALTASTPVDKRKTGELPPSGKQPTLTTAIPVGKCVRQGSPLLGPRESSTPCNAGALGSETMDTSCGDPTLVGSKPLTL
jgi:hypothetical protein